MALSPALLKHQMRCTEAAREAFALSLRKVNELLDAHEQLMQRMRQAVSPGALFDPSLHRMMDARMTWLETALEEARECAEGHRQKWLHEQMRLKGYEAIVEKENARIAYLKARAEQKAMDEFSARPRPREVACA